MVKYHENSLKGFRVMVRTKFYKFGRLWEITPESSRLELSFLNTTLLPNALYNLTKFHEKSSKGIELWTAQGFIYRRTPGRSLYSPNGGGGLSGRASALCSGGCGFDPRPGHTKDFKNGTSCSFAWRSALRK